MSRLNARRLTTGLLLALVLGLAAPAAAAPPDWSLPTVALDQVLEWLRSLLPGDGREGQGIGDPHSRSGAKDRVSSPPDFESDVTAVIDPNGGK